MALSYPITLPSNPAGQSVELSVRAAVGRGRNPFDQSVQLDDWGAQKIFASISLPPMTRAQGEPWLAALLGAQLGDMTFLLGPMGDQATLRGAGGGTPLVNGAHAAGVNTLAVKGLTVSASGVYLKGDWIQLGSGSTARLHKILNDVNADGSGNATLEITPETREAYADGAAIVTSSPKGLFRPSESEQQWLHQPGGILNGVTFLAEEAI